MLRAELGIRGATAEPATRRAIREAAVTREQAEIPGPETEGARTVAMVAQRTEEP